MYVMNSMKNKKQIRVQVKRRKFIPRLNSTTFFQVRMWNFANDFYEPVRRSDPMFFALFSAWRFVSYKTIWEIWNCLGQIYSARKRKEPPPGGQVSGWTCKTCAQKFMVYLLEKAGTFKTFVRKTCAFRVVVCNYMVFVHDRVFALCST